MIDITVYDNETRVEIDNTEHVIASQGSMIALMAEVLYKACYSGETITLWKVKDDDKILIGYYVSSPQRT